MVANQPITIAVRVTQLESFRRWWHEKNSGRAISREQEYIDHIKTPAPASRIMEMGTAFHAILASPQTYDVDGAYAYNGYEFDGSVIDQCLAHVQYDNALFEVPTYKVYSLGAVNILVTGTCDHLRGTVLTDYKTRWVGDASWTVLDDDKARETYEASYQWRFYCDMFGADEFHYLVFALREKPKYDIELVCVKDDIVCVPYSTMQEDLHTLLSHFFTFVRRHDLISYLQVSQHQWNLLNSAPF
jgi:hypothetical protein